jgi:hypothetical protein
MLDHLDHVAGRGAAADETLLAKIDGESIASAASRAGTASVNVASKLDAAPGDLGLDRDGARPVYQVGEAGAGRGHDMLGRARNGGDGLAGGIVAPDRLPLPIACNILTAVSSDAASPSVLRASIRLVAGCSDEGFDPGGKRNGDDAERFAVLKNERSDM